MTFDLLYITFLGIVDRWYTTRKEFEKNTKYPFKLTIFDYARTIDGFDEMVRCIIDRELERGEWMISPTKFDIIIDYDILGKFRPDVNNEPIENNLKMIFRDIITRCIFEIYYDYDPKWIDNVYRIRVDNHNGTFSTKYIAELIAPISKLIKWTEKQISLDDVKSPYTRMTEYIPNTLN